MHVKAARIEDLSLLDAPALRLPDIRPLVRVAGTALAATGFVAAMLAGASYSAGWILSSTLSSNPDSAYAQAHAARGLRALALIQSSPVLLGTEAYKPHVVSVIETPVEQPKVALLQPVPLPASPPFPPLRVAAPVSEPVPLPLARPRIEVAQARPQAAPIQLASASPDVPLLKEKPLQKQISLPPVTQNPVLPPRGSRIALYDISSHTVYLPSGRRLEAHSGVGERMDDPSQIRVKMRGPTPPNIYRLTLREALFHGVRAIRLNPTEYGKMYGRDGMLAHTYMLGPTGQSNGCVSFRDYNAFLQAYLNGEVDRMVVVPHLSEAPARIAEAMRDRVAAAE
jgi:type VI secretion system (T6SS) effector TldE1-like protein